MATTQPRLPPELIDNIVETVIQDCTAILRRPDHLLSSLALVSHRFRHHSLSHRFSSISSKYKTPLAELHTLVDLLKSDIWAKSNDLAHHVTNVELFLHGKHMADDILNEAYYDGTIAALLNLIFRGYGTPLENTLHTLSIHGVDAIYSDVRIDNPCSNFNNMRPDLMQALHDLFANSLLTGVQLRDVSQVPKSLLYSPTLTYLCLVNVICSVQPTTVPNLVLSNLKELEIDLLPPFLAVVWELTEDIFPVIQKVLVRSPIQHTQGLRDLACLGKKLNTLMISVHSNYLNNYSPPTTIDYSAFAALQELHLNLSYRFHVGWRTTHTERERRRPLFLDFISLLPKVFPPSLIILIDIANEKSLPMHDAIDEIHRYTYHPLLEEVLKRECPSSSIEVSISFGISIPSRNTPKIGTFDAKDALGHARSMFSSLDTMRGLKLNMKVYNFSTYRQPILLWRDRISSVP